MDIHRAMEDFLALMPVPVEGGETGGISRSIRIPTIF